MANTRKLARRVAVDGRWYGPGPVPDDIAEKITNPKAWAQNADAPDTADVLDTAPGTSAGAVLATRVAVDGRWYGPSDTVPDDVARRITNPKAWEGGVLPKVYDRGGEAPSGNAVVVNNGPEAEPVVSPVTTPEDAASEPPAAEPPAAEPPAAAPTTAGKKPAAKK